jgi:hypothetical protein
MLRVLARVRAPLLLFAIIAGFYWKLTLTRQYDWIWGADLAAQVLPWFEVAARQFHHGSFPLWDPYLWAGQPLLGQAQPGVAYPLNWLLFALPLHDGRILQGALQWYFVIIRMMAAFFCYLLCRDLRLSRTASIAGGIVFALSGFFAATGWPQMANGAVWLPLVFLFLLRAGRGRNPVASAALSGLFLGVAWLSGHHQVPMFAVLAAAGSWLYFIFRQGRPDLRMARAAAIAMLFTALAGAFQILPAYEYGRHAKRWAGAPEPLSWNQPVPYFVHDKYGLKGTDLIGIVIPGVRTHFDPFIGIVALSLVFLGVAAGWRDQAVRLMAAVGLAGLLYALANYTVLQGFLYSVVPALDKARTPSAAVVIFQFGAAVLAAFGLDRLGAADPSPWTKRVAWVAAGFGAFTSAVILVVFYSNKLSLPFDDHAVLPCLFALLVAVLLYGVHRGHLSARQAGGLAILLLLFDLGSDPVPTIGERADKGRNTEIEQMRANSDIAEFLKTQPGYFRANIPDDAFLANWGAYHGVEMWGGLLAGITDNLLGFGFHRYQSRMLYGVAYTIAVRPPAEPAEQIFAGASGMKVYRHPEVFPRTFAVHTLMRVRDRAAGDQIADRHLAGLRTTAFLLEAPPAVETCSAADEVTLYDHRASFVAIRARLACTGMVILSDTYFPGWHAYVDGASTRIYEVNEAMRGVVVPTGQHTVTMRYRPASATIGGVCGITALLGALVLWLTQRSRGA